MNQHASVKPEKDPIGHRGGLRALLPEAGPQGFHDYELIEFLLGLTIRRIDMKPLAKRLIANFGGIGSRL